MLLRDLATLLENDESDKAEVFASWEDRFLLQLGVSFNNAGSSSIALKIHHSSCLDPVKPSTEGVKPLEKLSWTSITILI